MLGLCLHLYIATDSDPLFDDLTLCQWLRIPLSHMIHDLGVSLKILFFSAVIQVDRNFLALPFSLLIQSFLPLPSLVFSHPGS